jgi:hypothetical protein
MTQFCTAFSVKLFKYFTMETDIFSLFYNILKKKIDEGRV